MISQSLPSRLSRASLNKLTVTDVLCINGFYNEGSDEPYEKTDLDFAYVAAAEGLIAAVRSGEITERRIDESLRRVLRAKIRAGIIAE